MECCKVLTFENEAKNSVKAATRDEVLSHKIEESLNSKISLISRQIAKKVLENQKVINITKIIHEEVLQLGAEIASVALNDIAHEVDGVNHQRTKGTRERNLTTILGPVSYERKAFYDPKENSLTFPADEHLGVCQGQLQPDVQSRIVKLGIEVPFAEATAICESLMGIKVSEGSIHNAVVKSGSLIQYEDVVPTKEEIHKKLDDLKITNPNDKVHIVVGIDGAMEPMRPQSSKRDGKRGECFWKECKGFRVFAIVGQDTIEQIASWHQIGSDEDLGIHLARIGKSLEGRKEPLIVVADGAKWIWNQVNKSFRSHIEILDWFHVVEHLAKFAELQFKDKDKRKQWLDKSKDRLMSDEVSTIIQGLPRMSYTSQASEEEAARLADYLLKNEKRLQYGTFKKNDFTIGSGGMESANKSVSHVRIKRNGSWWKSSHANEVLRLRCAKVNGTLDRFLDKCWIMERANLLKNKI